MTRMARAAYLLGVGAALAAAVACSTVLGIDGDFRASRTDAGEGDGGADASSLCDANLATDPSNCGACGRSCAGAACVAGRCVPSELATDVTASALAVDEAAVYWADPGDGGLGSGVVLRCSKDACADRSAIATLTRPIALDATNDSVFALASKDLAGGALPRVYRIGKTGGAVVVECSKSGSELTQASMVAVGDRVYVARSDDLVRCLDDCSADGCVRVLAEKTTAVVAQAGGLLFWLGNDAARAGVRRCTLSDKACAPDPATNTAVSSAEVNALAADDAGLFAVTDGGVVAIDSSTASSKALASVGSGVGRRVLQDASSLYVTTDASIVRVPKDGSAPLVLVEVASAVAVALDATHVYYVDPARRSLARVAK